MLISLREKNMELEDLVKGFFFCGARNKQSLSNEYLIAKIGFDTQTPYLSGKTNVGKRQEKGCRSAHSAGMKRAAAHRKTLPSEMNT